MLCSTSCKANKEHSHQHFGTSILIGYIANLGHTLPNDVRQAESIDSFYKRKLKSFYFKRFSYVFYGNNFCTFKIIIISTTRLVD